MRTRTKIKVALLLTLCFANFTAGLELRQPPKVVTKEVYVYLQEPVYQPIKQAKYFGQQRDKIAAAIPASALTPPRPQHKPAHQLVTLTYKKGE